jgi:hypothetical protein
MNIYGKNPESILNQTKGYSRFGEESFYNLFQTPQVFSGTPVSYCNNAAPNRNGP